MHPSPNSISLPEPNKGNGSASLSPLFSDPGFEPYEIWLRGVHSEYLKATSADKSLLIIESPIVPEQQIELTTLDSDTVTEQEEPTMLDNNEFETILEKLDKISLQHQADIHNLESRTDSRMTELKDSFIELRRDTREDIKEIKSIVQHLDSAVLDVRNSNQHIVIGVVLGAAGVALSVFLSVIYGSWTILGTLKAFIR